MAWLTELRRILTNQQKLLRGSGLMDPGMGPCAKVHSAAAFSSQMKPINTDTCSLLLPSLRGQCSHSHHRCV
ncbi:hypothetical protein EYF80_064183 [Liparis tanakae]|uniref:Uncharacterized protein n=1 Tax=Liparis tanakae TaxID=230148 RepID=A0A4Z2EA08_9TELE|nr:hypothetical protein EYF80_064183 [Liparis tanakae]